MQADQIDAEQGDGWSVVVVGRARQIAREALSARSRELLGSVPAAAEPGEVITVDAELVTGNRMMPGRAGAGGPAGTTWMAQPRR